jgi:ABC-type nitrate/sulfonate/bicarbonate transport system permease component
MGVKARLNRRWDAEKHSMLKIRVGTIRMRTAHLSSSRIGSQAIVVAVLILGWEFGARSMQSPLLPPLMSIATAWLELIFNGAFQRDLGISLATIAAGFLIALVLGVLLGITMARYQTVEKCLDPYMNALMTSPITALVPIIMLIFGSQLAARVVVVFLFSFFVICINTLTGVKNADRALIEMVRSFGANDRQITRIVALPGALPMILQGVRLGIARAVGGVLVAELLMALSGLGYQLSTYGAAFLTNYVYAILGTITFMAWMLSEAVRVAERRLSHWNRT